MSSTNSIKFSRFRFKQEIGNIQTAYMNHQIAEFPHINSDLLVTQPYNKENYCALLRMMQKIQQQEGN